jgi:adenylylsulfate reductase subunit A
VTQDFKSSIDARLSALRCEVAVIGGGTAGIKAAICLGELGRKVILVEKAFIERSGALAAGVNALNAYIGRGRSPEDYVAYAINDAHQIARTDLLLSLARRLNQQVAWLDSLGLGLHRDQNGDYLERSWRNVRVNGENLKPLLAAAVRKTPNVTILERTSVTHLLVQDNTLLGLLALQSEGGLVRIETPAAIIATGGAAGLYRPPTPGGASSRIWYPPFNTGSGLALGLRAGAEMTTLEMRFVALRCRGTMAPTGTLALGAGAEQVNSLNQAYEAAYGQTTSQRVWAARAEKRAGRGPCHLSAKADEKAKSEIYRAYLNMCPHQTLKFLEEEREAERIEKLALRPVGLEEPRAPAPKTETNERGSEEASTGRLKVEIGSSEPYIQGGHTAGGFWVDTNRRTTVNGLWAVGDAAGGAPQKYVTGALAEAEIAALDISRLLTTGELENDPDGKANRPAVRLAQEAARELQRHIASTPGFLSPKDLDEALQEIMDSYAGGLGSDYRYSQAELAEAERRIESLIDLGQELTVTETNGLDRLLVVRDKLILAKCLVAHLRARKETRWPGFGEYSDFPQTDERYLCHVNSTLIDQRIEIIRRPLVREEFYEHPPQ